MFDFTQLTLFPPGALQSSVVTTVWVGVCIVVFLNARFGTTLAGLVVPGYLVPLFFVKPASALVVLMEAYITYGLAWLFANKLLVRIGYSEMFGRDRFFALILLSVLVRILLDFFVLPMFTEHYGHLFAEYDLKNNLQSFGLIIVALIANQMWMGGVVKGSKALFLYLGLTFAFIYWVLIPFTNFNIGGLNYMYEDLATSLLSSPKAYIILLTTAFIASRMNLRFGWEFNGILIPSLLALQWYQPEKLLFTFVEALVILILGSAVMRLPLLRSITFEGGRLLLMFFNIGFLYKIVLGFALIEFLPTAKISDYYGFGYVVSTLIAVKIYEKQSAIKMAISTVFTSFVGIVAATCIGFLLTYSPANSLNQSQISTTYPIEYTEATVNQLYTQIRSQSFFDSSRPAPVNDSEALKALLNTIHQHQGSVEQLNTVINRLNQHNAALQMNFWITQNNFFVLYKKGVGFYVINPQPGSALVLEVPAARAELGADVLGLNMLEKTGARGLFIDLSYQLQSSGDYLFDSLLEEGYFQHFHRQFSNHNVLQIRGELKITEQRKKLRPLTDNAVNDSGNQLSVLRTIPADLPISLIDDAITELNIQWVDALPNPQWQHDGFGIAELRLNGKEMRSALARMVVLKNTASDSDIENLEGYLISWLIERKDLIARQGSDQYQRPEQEQLLYWHQDILIPLMQWLKDHEASGWTQQLRDELQRLNLLADSVGYEFRILRQPITNTEFLILQEQPITNANDKRKNWATLVVNLSARSEYIVAVPNPFFEKTSFEFGSMLFSQLQNRFLLLSGSHPWANPDGSSNVTLTGNKKTLYHIMFMAIAREFEERNITPVQIRGFSFQESRPFPTAQALVSLRHNINQYQPAQQVQAILEQLDNIGLQYRYVDGDFASSPYYLNKNQQIDYLNYVNIEEFITLWVSPLVRDSFKATDNIKVEEQHARLLGIPILRQDIRQLSLIRGDNEALTQYSLQQLATYAEQRNVHNLHNAMATMPDLKALYVLDSSSLQQFILLCDEQQNVVAGINLNSLNNMVMPTSEAQSLSEFVLSRFRWLLPNEVEPPQ